MKQSLLSQELNEVSIIIMQAVSYVLSITVFSFTLMIQSKNKVCKDFIISEPKLPLTTYIIIIQNNTKRQ